MQRKLKSFFRRAEPHSNGTRPETSSHQAPRPGPAQLLDQRRERGLGAHQHQRQSPVDQKIKPSGRQASQNSARRPIGNHRDHTVGATDNAPPPKPISEDANMTDKHGVRATPRSSISERPSSEFFGLRDDSGLRRGGSERKHSEDIADRNIDQHASKTNSKPNSRNNPLASNQQNRQALTDQNVRRKSVTTSVEAPGAVHSVRNSSLPASEKDVVEQGVPSEDGGLIDDIHSPVEYPNPLPCTKKNWPTPVASNKTHLSERRDPQASEPSEPSPNKTAKPSNDSSTGLREALHSGLEDYDKDLRVNLDGIVDLRNTEDADKETQFAQAVTHEVVKPKQHEIVQERIYREIHNHDVYHYIQPVYQTEILPARHWMYNSSGDLVEVPAEKLPDCTGANQRWSIARRDREKPGAHPIRSAPQAREPRITSDTTYITPEGVERRETTIVHPPELADLSNYDGPVVPIEFLHHPEQAPERPSKKTQKEPGQTPDGRHFTVGDLADALPVARTLTNGSSSTSRPPTGGTASTLQPSIPRKPIPALEP